jgi:hypothetical protein
MDLTVEDDIEYFLSVLWLAVVQHLDGEEIFLTHEWLRLVSESSRASTTGVRGASRPLSPAR